MSTDTREKLVERLAQEATREITGYLSGQQTRPFPIAVKFIVEGAISAALSADNARREAADHLAAPELTQVLAFGMCPECGPVSAVDAERCCNGCGHDVAMFDRPTLVTTPKLAAPVGETVALRAAIAAGWDDGVRFATEALRTQMYPRESAREACIDRLIGAMAASCETTPLPNSAEWWRQVAQGLSVEIAELKAEARSRDGD